MSYRPSYTRGGWLTICDQCGRQFKDSDLQLRWDGLMVCQGDWEPRQPQDFVRGVADLMRTPWARPESGNNFLLPNGFIPTVVSSSSATMSSTVIRTSKREINGSVLNSFTLG